MEEKPAERFYVEIVKDGPPEEVVKRMGPMHERRADKVADGASINLNHDEYSVRIVEG
jgi:hypothetical protein